MLHQVFADSKKPGIQSSLQSEWSDSLARSHAGSSGQISELQKELAETKDKLKVMTGKFTSTRKERDQLKTENKELQDEII